MAEKANEAELRRARASVAIKEVRAGRLTPESALFYAVWPSDTIREVERRVPRGTISARAYGRSVAA